MSYLYIMTFWLCLVESNKLCKKHVDNFVMPLEETEPAYNISVWVKELHLQQCVIVEIGEKYCGVFVEYRPTDSQLKTATEEYFLGLCDLDTLRKWKFCPPTVANERPDECIFAEYPELSNSPTRVHRRLCDVTGLAFYGDLCNCSSTVFSGKQLSAVTGFPTCFLQTLPQSLCTPGNVCGISSCTADTINHIHTVKCNPRCFGYQPFCESTGPETTRASEIYSYWSDWREPPFSNDLLNSTSEIIQTEAICINKNTGLGAVDCLGPGTNCCPHGVGKCKCWVYIEDGILKLSRELELQQSYKQVKRNINFDKDAHKRNLHLTKHLGISRFLTPGVNTDKRNKPKDDEYEEVDDIDDDIKNEDVILDEDESNSVSPEKAEKSELKHNQNKPVTESKIAIEEMAIDLNNTKQDEVSKGSAITSALEVTILLAFLRAAT